MSWHIYNLYKIDKTIIYTSSKTTIKLCNQLGGKYLFKIGGGNLFIKDDTEKFSCVSGLSYRKILKALLDVKKADLRDLPLLLVKYQNDIKNKEYKAHILGAIEKRLKKEK